MKKSIKPTLVLALILSGVTPIKGMELTSSNSSLNEIQPRTNYDWWQYDISIAANSSTQFQGPYSSGYFLIHKLGSSYDYNHKLYVDFGGKYGSVDVAIFIKQDGSWKETTSFTLSGTNQVSKSFVVVDRSTGYSDVFKVMLFNRSSKSITLASIGLVTE